MLNQYVTETQELLNDQLGQFFKLSQVTRYVNKSRRRIAGASGCIRCMPPGTQTHPQQEVYPFSDWISLIQGVMPGVESILACRSLAVAIGPGGWKPLWRRIVWTDFQSRFRIYNKTFFGTISEPGWYAQYGAGPLGALYLAPIPSQATPIEVDLTLIPAPLLSDDDPEIIPYPWADAVPYWAAMLLLLAQQRGEDAKSMALLFNAELPMCASVVCPTMIQSTYAPGIQRSA
jgi:hypothetical protein